MNNCKGFSLIEVMTSLLVLTVFSIVFIPTLITVYNERLAIQQERKAINHLDKVITSWIFNEGKFSEDEIIILDTTYKITLAVDEKLQQLRACITWKAANGRHYERCESGKR